MSVVVAPGTATLFDHMAQTGRVLDPNELVRSGTTILDAEVVVVGTGAGGSACFRELALAGVDVLALEAGAWHWPHRDFNQREETMLHRLYYNQGARADAALTVTITHGRGVGGSTAHNINLSENTPATILARWADEAGVRGWSDAEMAPVFERVRRMARVVPMDEGQVNANNALLRRGAMALGWRGALYDHNRFGCLQCGYCALGCAYNRKQSALLTYMPAGVMAGGRLAWGAQVDRVTVQGGAARGVTATLVDPESGRRLGSLQVRCKTVVVAGSSLLSPALLQRSGIRDPHGIGGTTLRIHPAVAVAARFDEPVDAWHGLPQSYVVQEFASFYQNGHGGFLIIPIFGHPGMSAAMISAGGATLGTWLKSYRFIAAATPLVHDETKGRVTASGDRVDFDYALNEGDQRSLREGIKRTAEAFLAAGARDVLLPFARREVIVTRASDLAIVDALGVGGDNVVISSVHPQGALPMAADPARGACDARGQHFGVRDLWIADGSLFPTSVGVPPQLSIYAAGTKVAREILRQRSAAG